MRKPWLLLLAAPWLAAAATGVLDKLEIRHDWAEQRLIDFTLRAEMPSIPAPVKNLGPDKGSREVKPLGDAAKAIFASESFKQHYAAYRKDQTPPPAAVARATPDLVAEQKKLRAEQLAGLDKAQVAAAMMPPAQRKQFEAFLEAQHKQLADTPIDASALTRMEALRVSQDKERYDHALAQMPPEDPRVALRLALAKALADTDSDAPANRTGQACLRAGVACEAARAYARAWLKELK